MLRFVRFVILCITVLLRNVTSLIVSTQYGENSVEKLVPTIDVKLVTLLNNSTKILYRS